MIPKEKDVLKLLGNGPTLEQLVLEVRDKLGEEASSRSIGDVLVTLQARALLQSELDRSDHRNVTWPSDYLAREPQEASSRPHTQTLDIHKNYFCKDRLMTVIYSNTRANTKTK